MPFKNCFGNNPGEGKPVVLTPPSLDDLISLFFNAGDEYVWRGQADFSWAPYPTLYRRIKNSGISEERIFESKVRRIERQVLEAARNEGVLGSDDSVFEFMARLQHHGGATRLLDVTTNYDVALYFASSQDPDVEGTVLAYRANPKRKVSLKGLAEKSVPGWDDLLEMARRGRPLLIVPEPYDRRIAVQSGAFLTTSLAGSLSEPNIFTHQTYDCEVTQILISPKLKQDLKDYLEVRGITRKTLFPSIEDFSQKNRACDRLLDAF